MVRDTVPAHEIKESVLMHLKPNLSHGSVPRNTLLDKQVFPCRNI